MFRPSIQRKIVGIALGLIVLMVVTSALSIVMALTVGGLLDELTTKYVPAYGHLARTNVRSLERALALRRMVIAKMQTPPDEAGYVARLKIFDDKGQDVAREAAAARQLIASIIADANTPSDNVALARIDTRIEEAVTDLTRHMNEETAALLSPLEARDFPEVRRALERVDGLRDEFNQKVDSIRADMLAQVSASSATIIRNQKHAILISAVVTALAAILGLVFALLVSSGITRPVRRLLEGTREVETGRLDRSIAATTRAEIGELTAAFNRMVEQLRQNERVRETFGRYIDPKVVEGLINRPALAEVEGQRRVMTVMFCDMKGFSTLSEGMTPQGLVKVMNRYLSTMSEPIRNHRGIIDKYIGDAIMAYWGPPFVEAADQATAACLAAIDMIDRIPDLAQRPPRAARRAQHSVGVRPQDRHRDRRGAGREHRLGVHDELHRDGRHGESGSAPGSGQQDLRYTHPGVRGDCCRGPRRGRRARDRPHRRRRPEPASSRLRNHGAQGRRGAEGRSVDDQVWGGACGVSGSPLGGGTRGLQCSARGGAGRWPIKSPCGAD